MQSLSQLLGAVFFLDFWHCGCGRGNAQIMNIQNINNSHLYKIPEFWFWILTFGKWINDVWCPFVPSVQKCAELKKWRCIRRRHTKCTSGRVKDRQRQLFVTARRLWEIWGHRQDKFVLSRLKFLGAFDGHGDGERLMQLVAKCQMHFQLPKQVGKIPDASTKSVS